MQHLLQAVQAFSSGVRMSLLAKAPCWNSKREEEMGESNMAATTLTLYGIFFSLKIEETYTLMSICWAEFHLSVVWKQ